MRATQRDIVAAYRIFLDREPDPAGLRTHSADLKTGLTLDELRVRFLTSPEYQARIRNESPSESRIPSDGLATMGDVYAAYRLFLKREPDPEGLATYRAAVQRGLTIEDLRDNFSRSDEFRAIEAAEVVTVDLGGYQVCCRRSELDFGKWIVESGVYEPHVQQAISKLLRPGQTFVDIGANIGCISFLAASIVGENGRVYAIEPNPDNLQLLYAGITLNRYSNVHVLPYAVSDDRHILSLVGGTSNTHVTAARHYSESGFFAQSVRLDDTLSHLPSIDFVKIDIEGYEPVALAGFESLLRRHRPILLTEFNPHFLARVQGFEPMAYLQQLAGWYSRFHVLTAFGDSAEFANVLDIWSYWQRRTREIAASGKLPEGMLHFDIIATFD